MSNYIYLKINNLKRIELAKIKIIKKTNKGYKIKIINSFSNLFQDNNIIFIENYSYFEIVQTT
jgi:hypothetical protein